MKPILAIQWAPDGKTIRCATGAATVEKLDATSLSLWSSQSYGGHWQQARFSDNGLLLAASSDEVRLFNCVSARRLWMHSCAKESAINTSTAASIMSIALSPHGDMLAFKESAGDGGYLNLLQVHDVHVVPIKNESRRIFMEEDRDFVALSGDGVIAWDNDGRGSAFGLRKVSGGKPRYIQIPSSVSNASIYPMACTFSPDNRTLALNLSNGTLLWDVRLNRAEPFLSGGTSNVKVVPAFSSDSRTLATTNAGGRFDLWNVANGSLKKSFASGALSVNSLAFSPDNSHLAIGTSTGQVQLWRLQ